jgi:quercetin dioxygenase-like cupin family protein
MQAISTKEQRDISRYSILKVIPHHRVQYNDEEIFDLYQLGTYTAKSSLLATLHTITSEVYEYQEQIEIVELQPSTKYRPHYHKKSAAIIYIIHGTGRFILDKKNIHYHPGQRIEIPAGMLHGFLTDTRTLFLSIQSPPIIDRGNDSIDLYYGDEYDN